MKDGSEKVGKIRSQSADSPKNITQDRSYTRNSDLPPHFVTLTDVAEISFLLEEKSRLQERTRKLSEMVDQSDDAVIQTDVKGIVEYVNGSTLSLFGYNTDEVIGKRVSLFYSDSNAEEIKNAILKEIKNGKTYKGTLLNIKKNGETFWCSIKVTPLRDAYGKVHGYMNVLRDISDIIEAERRAETANRAKSDFLANMSHEIRTPMNAIIGFNQILLQADIPAKYKDFISKSQQSANHLLELINEILDFSKIESGNMRLETISFNIFKVISNVRQVVGRKAEEKGLAMIINVDADIPPVLKGDPMRIAQILINLAGNAVKFTEIGFVKISVLWNSSKKTVYFAVSDTGIGISDENISRLFTPFEQLESSTSRLFGGTGLGLSISKKLVESMGGSIGVESEIGQGSSFFFTLPLRTDDNTDVGSMKHFPETYGIILNESRCGHIAESLPFVERLIKRLDRAESVDELKIMMAKAESCGFAYRFVVTDRMTRELREFLNSPLRKKCTHAVCHLALVEDGCNPHDIDDDSLALHCFKKGITRSDILGIIQEISLHDDSSSLFRHLSEQLHADVDINARLLVVEDNRVNRRVAEELLKGLGFMADFCVDGAEAVKKLSDPKVAAVYKMVFMDIQMPVMDGYEATKKLRNFEHLKEMPIIALTADAARESIEKAERCGMNGYLTKPFMVEELAAAIGRWMKTDSKKAAPMQENTESELYGIDMDFLINNIGGDREFLMSLLIVFYEDKQDIAERLHGYIESGDVKSFIEHLHSFIGAASNCGAVGITKIGREMYNRVKSDGMGNILPMYEDFADELSRVMSAIRTKIQD